MTASRRGFFGTLLVLPAIVMGRKSIASSRPQMPSRRIVDGLTGGQTIIGGTGACEILTLSSGGTVVAGSYTNPTMSCDGRGWT